MAFRDLADVLGVAPDKVLPINGQDVRFPGRISARTGQLLLATNAAVEGGARTESEIVERLQLSEEDLQAVEEDLLGPAAAVLDGLGVVGEARQHVMATLTVWHLAGQDAAENVWEAGPGAVGKAPPRGGSKRKAGRSSPTARTRATTAAGRSRAGAGGSSARPRKATSRGGSSSTGRS
jgi:hypothetical protein